MKKIIAISLLLITGFSIKSCDWGEYFGNHAALNSIKAEKALKELKQQNEQILEEDRAYYRKSMIQFAIRLFVLTPEEEPTKESFDQFLESYRVSVAECLNNEICKFIREELLKSLQTREEFSRRN